MLPARTVVLSVLAAAATAAATTASLRADDGDARSTAAYGVIRPLPFTYDFYTFRGSGDSTVVVAAFAVAAGRLEREEVERHIRYRFDVSMVLADTTLRTVYRSDDSVFVTLPRALAGEHLLTTHVHVQAPPSLSTVQRVVMTDATTPGIGQLYTSPFPIPDYSGSHLMLSDIALSQPDPLAGWRRGDVTLALLPTGEFPGSAFDVYYEIYNLPAGNSYITEVTLERVADADGVPVADPSPVRMRYADESPARADGAVHELRRVESSVGIGSYRLSVTITDEESGQSAIRSRTFRVSGSAPAATLVAALPRGYRHLQPR